MRININRLDAFNNHTTYKNHLQTQLSTKVKDEQADS
jgi:hypothetical protein